LNIISLYILNGVVTEVAYLEVDHRIQNFLDWFVQARLSALLSFISSLSLTMRKRTNHCRVQDDDSPYAPSVWRPSWCLGSCSRAESKISSLHVSHPRASLNLSCG
jgi:hypothetical protein